MAKHIPKTLRVNPNKLIVKMSMLNSRDDYFTLLTIHAYLPNRPKADINSPRLRASEKVFVCQVNPPLWVMACRTVSHKYIDRGLPTVTYHTSI